MEIKQKDMPYLVVDLEGTCCNDGSIPKEDRETIEIGAVIATSDGLIISEFDEFVLPLRYPQLTPYCMELTGITQKDIDQASIFREVFSRFTAWWIPFRPLVFCSWGLYDVQQFQRDCTYQEVPFPFHAHLNLSEEFTRNTGRKRGHRKAMEHFGITPTGTHHRGIDDARNIARILPFLVPRNLG